MPTLNIINKSPFEKRTLEQCLPRLGEGDSILLIEDACVAAVSGTSIEKDLENTSKQVKLFVLQPDLAARGLADSNLLAAVSTVDYAGFVELVANHDRVHSWL